MRQASGWCIWILASFVLASGCENLEQYLEGWSAQARPGRTRPRPGPNEFISADPYGSNFGQRSSPIDDSGASTPTPLPPTATPSGGNASTGRAVERGDLFRLLPDGRIVNLNAYRGVQILDVRDVSQPRLEGRVALAGSPVELYVVGDRAIVLLNNWQGYYGSRTDIPALDPTGGLVVSVDLSDRANPVITDRAAVGGDIVTSRLTQGAGQAALYVAATDYSGSGATLVKSFDVTTPEITPRSELSLEGYAQDVQATTELLLVASLNYATDANRSRVTLVDISRPDGAMQLRGSVRANGVVRSKFNMDARDGILRIVSESNTFPGLLPAPGGPPPSMTTPPSRRHQLETFSLADPNVPQPIDRCSFGDVNPETGQLDSLFATVFLDDRAFFVTYLRVDPFHAFSIDAEGRCEEHNEFLVSGWNDFLRPALDDTRLIGVGRNDANDALKLSVSLYDAVNLTNSDPLLARSEVDLNFAYSVANWDDRGFSVIEDAVSVAAADGTVETGLLLLPFEGYAESTQRYEAGVQLFTFSDRTLTRRGSMDHGSSVLRSFGVGAGATANLSNEQLSLFDTQNPDEPAERGRLALVRNYTRVLVFGEYVARLRNDGIASLTDHVEIVPRGADLDSAAAAAEFEVPANSTLIQVDELLVVATSTITNESEATSEVFEPEFLTTLQVYDLSDPLAPRARGQLETDRLAPDTYGYPFPIIDCIGGRCGGLRSVGQNFVVGRAIAFTHMELHRESLGNVHVCDRYVSIPPCEVEPNGSVNCPMPPIQGGITCTTREGGEEECFGSFYTCTSDGLCEPTTVPADVVESCYDYEDFRSWWSYAFDSLDLRDPDQPALAPRLELPENEQATTMIAAGTTVYFNYQTPYDVRGDERNYVKHWVRQLSFADPATPDAGPAVNVPGEVVAAEGVDIVTSDWQWRGSVAVPSVARATIDDGLATLEARRTFTDRSVSVLRLDGAGHVFVATDPRYDGPIEEVVPQTRLSVLDLDTLATVGETDVDSWAYLRHAAGGRVVFEVSGGLLIVDATDAANPRVTAYHQAMIWGGDQYFDGEELILALGWSGITRIDATLSNLVPQ